MKELSNELKNKKLFLLDIDGTISFDSTLFEGSMEFFREVEKRQRNCVFITNNSTRSISGYVEKFTKMGVKVDERSFLTSSYASAVYLKEKYQQELLFAAGTQSFIQELREFGIRVTEDKREAEIKAVIVGFDNELTYQKVQDVCELLETRDVDYIATNPDLACPVGFGYVPDCGAICLMIEQAAKRKPLFIGKPNPLMVEMSMKRFGCSREETVVIGDRLYTDIASGNRAGVDTVVVFTGETKKEDLKDTEFPPSYYCDSILDIYHVLAEKEETTRCNYEKMD